MLRGCRGRSGGWVGLGGVGLGDVMSGMRDELTVMTVSTRKNKLNALLVLLDAEGLGAGGGGGGGRGTAALLVLCSEKT